MTAGLRANLSGCDFVAMERNAVSGIKLFAPGMPPHYQPGRTTSPKGLGGPATPAGPFLCETGSQMGHECLSLAHV